MSSGALGADSSFLGRTLPLCQPESLHSPGIVYCWGGSSTHRGCTSSSVPMYCVCVCVSCQWVSHEAPLTREQQTNTAATTKPVQVPLLFLKKNPGTMFASFLYASKWAGCIIPQVHTSKRPWKLKHPLTKLTLLSVLLKFGSGYKTFFISTKSV